MISRKDERLQVSQLQLEKSVRCWDWSEKCKVVKAHDGPEFLGDADAFKRLFALPVTESSATFALHRVGTTLVLDGGNTEKSLEGDEGITILDDGGVIESKNGEELLEGFTPALQLERHVATALAPPYPHDDQDSDNNSDEDETRKRQLTLKSTTDTLKEEQRALFWKNFESPKREYGLISAWRLAELRFVSGVDSSDSISTADSSDPSISSLDSSITSLHTSQVDQQQSRRLAVLDTWLNNILTGAPRLAERLHEFGVVAGGLDADSIEEKDTVTFRLPLVTAQEEQHVSVNDQNPKSNTSSYHNHTHTCGAFNEADVFDSSQIELHAAALLRFLYEHCEKDGATYVLSRERGGILKLFDLGALCDQSKRRWKWYLATMSVRLARQLEAHLVADAEDLLAPKVARDLRSRQRLLLETASELFAEIAELKGGKHLLMRASVHEQLAASYLAGKTCTPGPENYVSFFSSVRPPASTNVKSEVPKATCEGRSTSETPSKATPPARRLGLEALRSCDSDALEKARRQLRLALDLVSQEVELVVFAERAKALKLELSRGVVDATLALARQHLDARRPSGLMHELKSAASELRSLTLDVDSSRRAAMWHCAAVFSYGVATERFTWSERGAHSSDAMTLLLDLQDALPEDKLEESPSLCAALAKIIESRAAQLMSKRDLMKLRAIFIRKESSQDNDDTTSTAYKQVEEKQPKALLLTVAQALGACLQRAPNLSETVVISLSRQLAEVCSRTAVLTSDTSNTESAQRDAVDWIATALAYAVTSSPSDLNLLIAIRLNFCVIERRLAILCDSNEENLLEALRQIEAAAALLGSEQGSVWTQVHEELAISNLHLGTARRNRIGREWQSSIVFKNYDERLVLDPLRAALRAHEKLRGSKSTQVAADYYQIGAYLLQVFKYRLGNKTASSQYKTNKALFDQGLENFHISKSIFSMHKLPSHVLLSSISISDLLDLRRRHLVSSPRAQASEEPIGLALASLVELIESRGSLRNVKDGAQTRRAIESRLPERAKALLQLAIASQNAAVISHCKAAYQAILKHNADIESILDDAAMSIDPLIKLLDAPNIGDSNSKVPAVASSQQTHEDAKVSPKVPPSSSSESASASKKRRKKKKKPPSLSDTNSTAEADAPVVETVITDISNDDGAQ